MHLEFKLEILKKKKKPKRNNLYELCKGHLNKVSIKKISATGYSPTELLKKKNIQQN